MITDAGKLVAGRTLAAGLGTHIAVGVGSGAPTVGDTDLEFEVYRSEIRIRSYDPETQRVVLAATVPNDIELIISEVALLTTPSESGTIGMLTSFADDLAAWTGGTVETDNMRVSSSGLTVALGTASMNSGRFNDMANIQQSDYIDVAYFGAGGNVEIKLKNTDTDYYTFSFPVQAGYNIYSVPVYDLTATGTPMLNSVVGMDITHSGTGSVTMDAVRVRSEIGDETLVLRQVLTEPFHKIEGMPLDIEVPVVI